ncbi:hypothetical protein H257_19389, partial [Aphanomyces astaci]
GTGVKHDPARVEALQQLPSPVSGADLQQYMCAINWMRISIPGYNMLVQPLTEMLERVFAAGGGKRTKQAAAAVLLEDIGWSVVHDDCLAKTNAVLGNVMELCHPDPQQRLCVFADSSEGHCGSVITQYTAQKLERWALLLMGYSYVIHDIPGEVNVWADLLSRWGSTLPSICAISQQPLLISPLRDEKFVWPTFVSIAEAQVVAPDDVLSRMTKSLDAVHLVVLASGQAWLLRLVDDVIWVPVAAAELQLRLCVCVHASLAGHRTAKATLASLESFCQWTGMKGDVEFFVRRCLHCASASGGSPRPLGEALHSTAPNGLIHWDFVFMGASKTGGDKYLLVVKCDASNMVWFFPAPEATATFVKYCLLQWFAVFAVCYEWVSEQGTHFKNQVIAELQHVLGAHHFTTARCLWANGTVEVVMQQLLRLFRACLSEWRMAPDQWPEAHLVSMLVLNQLPSPSLGGMAPVTAMSDRPAMSPAETMALPGQLISATLAEVEEGQRENIAALEEMHKQMLVENARKRDRLRQYHDKKKGVQMAQKLRTKWCGPAVVTEVTSNWVYNVENLLAYYVRPVHASRLIFYEDCDLDVMSELLAHVAHNSEGFEVEAMVDARYVPTTNVYELLIKWRGLQDADNSWKPANNIFADLPVMFKAFCKAATSAVIKKIAVAYEVM